MHEPATLLSAERRQAILAALARDGKVVAARLVEELGVSEDTVRRDLQGARRPGPRPARPRGRARARAAAGLLQPPARDLDGREAGARAGRHRRARGRAGDPARRLDDEPRARAPAAARSRLHRADQLAADRLRAGRPPLRRGRDDRRPARQARAGDGRRRRRRLHPQRARRRLRARRLRAAPRGRPLHGRPRGGARQARDGGGVGRRDRARDRRQAAGRQHLPRRAGRPSSRTWWRRPPRPMRCSTRTARSA